MGKRVIVYIRVSTAEQADRGFSLNHQEAVIRQHCKINGYTIIKLFSEDYSAKNFDRPEWKKLMLFISQNKREVDSVIFLRWDRFSRNQYEATTVIRQLQKLGIGVESVEQNLNLDNPDSLILLNMYLTIPEVENSKNSIRTTEGSRAARLSGCWTGSAPIGYKNYRDPINGSVSFP